MSGEKRKPTIAELEAIIQSDDCPVRINPDGSVSVEERPTVHRLEDVLGSSGEIEPITEEQRERAFSWAQEQIMKVGPIIAGSAQMIRRYEAALSKAEARIAELEEALRKLTAWSKPFLEDTPISAETLWREFPLAVKNARTALKGTAP